MRPIEEQRCANRECEAASELQATEPCWLVFNRNTGRRCTRFRRAEPPAKEGKVKTLDDIVRENATSTGDESVMERIQRLDPDFIEESFAAAEPCSHWEHGDRPCEVDMGSFVDYLAGDPHPCGCRGEAE